MCGAKELQMLLLLGINCFEARTVATDNMDAMASAALEAKP